jgi:hypothetical protein
VLRRHEHEALGGAKVMTHPQTAIPDDLKANADLPLDVISALAAMRFQLTLTLRALDDLIEAVEAR